MLYFSIYYVYIYIYIYFNIIKKLAQFNEYISGHPTLNIHMYCIYSLANASISV